MFILLRLARAILKILGMLVTCGIFFFLFGYAKGYINDIEKYSYLNKIAIAETKTTDYIRQHLDKFIPTRIMDIDITPPLCILILIIVSSNLRAVREKINDTIEFSEHKSDFEKTVKDVSNASESELITELHNKLVALGDTKKKNRQQLIHEFVTLKRDIDAMGRDLSFLSVDVVNSTGMKKDGDPLQIAYDFDHYNAMLKEILQKNQCLKFTTTPDGTMACFDTVDHAVNCGQEILTSLKSFNADVKHGERNFVVRIGINSGFVLYDEEEPLENLVDRVVDIAAHMQKHAEPNTIFIAKHAIEPLKHRTGFEEIDKVVDEIPVYTWQATTHDKKEDNNNV